MTICAHVNKKIRFDKQLPNFFDMYANGEPNRYGIIKRDRCLISGCLRHDAVFIWKLYRNAFTPMDYLLSIVKKKILYVVKNSILFTRYSMAASTIRRDYCEENALNLMFFLEQMYVDWKFMENISADVSKIMEQK